MKWGLKDGISIYADSEPPRYVLWCCGCISHEVLTFIQIGCCHTVNDSVSRGSTAFLLKSMTQPKSLYRSRARRYLAYFKFITKFYRIFSGLVFILYNFLVWNKFNNRNFIFSSCSGLMDIYFFRYCLIFVGSSPGWGDIFFWNLISNGLFLIF